MSDDVRSRTTVRQRSATSTFRALSSLDDALPLLEQLLDRPATGRERELLARSLDEDDDFSFAFHKILDLEEELIAQPTSFVLRDLVQEVAATSMRRLSQKSVEVIVLCDERFGRPVQGDARVLHRLLANLLDNALRYNEDGGEVLISVSATEGEGRAIEACFNITDTGMGMNSAVLESLSGDGHEHLGYGLRCVRRLVDVLGAEFQVQSMEGDGTNVVLRLPLEIDEDAEEEIWSFQHVSALIVDGSGGGRMSLEFECDRLGCRFRSVSTQEEALGLAADFDVVIAAAPDLLDEEALGLLRQATEARLVGLVRDTAEITKLAQLGLDALTMPIQRRQLAALFKTIK